MKCLVIDYIDEEVFHEFKKYMDVDLMMLPTKQTLTRIIAPYDILIMRVDPEIDESVLEAAKNLKFIGVCSTGLNHIDQEAAKKRGILIQNSPGMNANAVANATITPSTVRTLRRFLRFSIAVVYGAPYASAAAIASSRVTSRFSTTATSSA